MTEPLPTFRYHPDPVATGSVEPSGTTCRCCGRARGAIYVGPTFAVEDIGDELCPWCIADGSAAAQLAVTFTDIGSGVPDDVPEAVLTEVSTRTPGFSGWQQEHWLHHCADACAFVGRAGWDELQAHPDAVEALRADGAVADVEGLDADGSATAYLFRCLTCGTHLAYADTE